MHAEWYFALGYEKLDIYTCACGHGVAKLAINVNSARCISIARLNSK